jgi:hypothetical protein
MATDSTIMRYPDQFVRQNVYASQFDRTMKAFNNRQTKRIGEDKYRFINNCFVIPSGSVTLNRNYSEGLGQTEYFRDDQTDQEFYRLVYFKKGTETWGNPVGTQCSPMLDIDEQSQASLVEVHVVPNPFKNQARITVEGLKVSENVMFILYNSVGREVYRMNIDAGDATLDRNSLPAGLYIYMVKGKNITKQGKLVIE